MGESYSFSAGWAWVNEVPLWRALVEHYLFSEHAGAVSISLQCLLTAMYSVRPPPPAQRGRGVLSEAMVKLGCPECGSTKELFSSKSLPRECTNT